MTDFLASVVHPEDPFAVLGLVLVLVLLWGLYRVHRDGTNPYDLADLVTTGDRYDLSKVGTLTALITTTWLVIHMELRHATVEWMVLIYCLAWVGARFGSMYAAIRSGVSPTRDTASQPNNPPPETQR